MNKNRQNKNLEQELIQNIPKRWKTNLPFRDYKIHIEDIIPAFSGTIGKISLISGFVVSWATALNVKNTANLAEMVRQELFIACVFTLFFCAIFNPAAAPPGSLAPMIPLVAVFASQGVDPAHLGILIGVFGILFSCLHVFDFIIAITVPSIRGGIILLFSVIGINSSLENLNNWASGIGKSNTVFALVITCAIAYVFISKLNLKWMAIPLCAAIALILSALAGAYPVVRTSVSMPSFQPYWWWTEVWGIKSISASGFVKALPYALLVMIMWPIDVLPVKSLQEQCYPREAERSLFHMRDTFLVISLRNLAGTLLGGVHISSIWRSFMIPLSIAKRPMAGGAFLLSIFGLIFAFLGSPVDIAMFPPLLWLVLIFGVHIPLLEFGLSMITSKENVVTASICFLLGISVSPIIGWSISLILSSLSFTIKRRKSHISILNKKALIIGFAGSIMYMLTIR